MVVFSWLFKLILNFIRSNIIYYIIKCKTYIIKISQHFTDHLIKISGAVPGGINLAKPQVLLLCSAVSVSVRKRVLLPGNESSSCKGRAVHELWVWGSL